MSERQRGVVRRGTRLQLDAGTVSDDAGARRIIIIIRYCIYCNDHAWSSTNQQIQDSGRVSGNLFTHPTIADFMNPCQNCVLPFTFFHVLLFSTASDPISPGALSLPVCRLPRQGRRCLPRAANGVCARRGRHVSRRGVRAVEPIIRDQGTRAVSIWQ